ncbi:MAG: hypothetical protein Q4C95_12115 [Planctomycetia bacterium]|nr:hypothetical protein [Planctomycetia bacterium]
MSFLDWMVVSFVIFLTVAVGSLMIRFASRHGAESYFTGDRKLPWWAIAISNTATYQSGNGGFVMLILIYGLAANWIWWASWIIWMPLVAIVWAPLWRRMRIMTTAELLTLRYGGRPAWYARKIYALVCCFGFSVLIIGYITGFFAITIAPIVDMEAWQILLIFGGTTAIYTIFGGLVGVVATEVLHFIIMMVGSVVFLFIAIQQHGGWGMILERISTTRPEALQEFPPVLIPGSEAHSIPLLTILFLILQGVFFAGSPTAGEGATAQRFMSAKSEGHAIGGQLFNCFLALTCRTLPLIGLGLVATSIFWPETLTKVAALPEGMRILKEPAHAWAELIKSCQLPPGFVGLLISVEIAAYVSTLSALINWGSSFIINDIYRDIVKKPTAKQEIFISRITTLVLFIAASVIALLFVKKMISWFMFINSAMVIFLLPLSFFRFFWWRFNVWGELSAILLGLPLSIIIWFGLDFQNPETHPFWHGLALLLGLSFVVLIIVTLLTPAESKETLLQFYQRCHPPGLWKPIEKMLSEDEKEKCRLENKNIICYSIYGILACLGLVVATNALFVANWFHVWGGVLLAGIFGTILVLNVIRNNVHEE